MSTATLVAPTEKPMEADLTGGSVTPVISARNSFETKDLEKLPAEEQDDGPPPMSKPVLALLVLGLNLSIFLVALDFNIITTAIPQITDQFKDLNSVAWYGSAFFLTTSSLQGPWGKFYKFYNLKWTFMSALFIFEIGSLMCAVAQNNVTLIVGRAIQGAGASGLANGTYTISGVVIPAPQRPMFTGILGATFGITCVIGPLLGGVFTDQLSWRWCFYINLPLGGAVAILLFFSMKPPKHTSGAGMSRMELLVQLDPLGIALLLGATLCALLGLQKGGITNPWSSSQVIGLFVGFPLLFILFILDQWYMGERASYPFRILRGRNVAVGVAWNLLIGGAFITHMYFLPLYFQSVRGVSAIQSGVHILPLILGLTVFSIVAAGFITSVGMPFYFMFSGAALACVGSGLVYMLDINTSSANWIGYLALVGFGYGFTLQLGIIVGQASSKPEDIAVATAAINFTQTYGGAIFVAVGQNIFSNKLIQGITSSVQGVDPQVVIAVGATNLQSSLTPTQYTQVLRVFMDSLKDAYVIPIALTGCAFFLALCLDKNMRAKGGIKIAAA